MNVFFEYKAWHFEWDSEKESANIKKHGVNFDRAAIFFRDGESVIEPDYKHGTVEERWVVLGLDNRSQLLAVCVTWRETDTDTTSYRIISAHEVSARTVTQFRKRLLK